ncbi:MAG: DNA polymerase III subunit beta [Sphaerochaetaceae bacterium]
MKFICSKNSILNEISNAIEFAAVKNILSILSNVYLEAFQDKLYIRSTDSNLSFSAEIVVNVIEEGKTTLRCDTLLNILKNIPDDEVVFEEKENIMYISAAEHKINFNIKSTKVDDFPNSEKYSDSEFFKIPKKTLLKLINQTIFTVSLDEKKPFMNGTLLTKEDDFIIMVGTDGKRLSFAKEKIENDIPDFSNAIIPLKFLNIIKKFSISEGTFDVLINNTSMVMKFNNYVISSVLINANYPNYKRVIPENNDKFIKIKINDMNEALKRVSLFSENKYKKILFNIDSKKITIYTEDSEIGQAKEEIEAEYEGEPFTCAINYSYLVNPLKAMEGEFFCIWFNDPTRAFIVKPEPEREYLHVIMPMQIN